MGELEILKGMINNAIEGLVIEQKVCEKRGDTDGFLYVGGKLQGLDIALNFISDIED